MVSTVTTWNNAAVGSGTILNQVQNVYNEFGQQTNSYQAHDGSVNVATTPVVRFNYYHGGGNRIRIAGMTYPNGRALTYDYGVANGMNDACSRIESIIDPADAVNPNLATYQYLGTSGFVNVASAQPGINWTLYGTTNDPNTSDIYSGLDRFGRVDNCLWKKGTTTLGQIQYGYDRASNRTWRKDGVLTGYDELYAYDGLYRLNDQKRGTLNGTQTAITTGTFEQQWGLDATGNWKTFKQDNDGNGTWELNQTRTANKANEITGITNTVGAAWATPTYDPAGNMAGIPNPQSLSAEYDAWNRLVLIKDGATTVSQHVYDARGYRIRKDTYTSGTLTEARHYYYTPGWQCVEERTGTLTTVERQFVWGLRYIDDLVLRDRSTANNGTINERRYAMQDGNWNTIAICDITGFVGERYAYSAYGTPVFMTGAGVVQASSAIGFETLYAGYRYDGTTPQMYYVRNRFLLPMIGTWNRRDPLAYIDGFSLMMMYGAVRAVDPYGLESQAFNSCVGECFDTCDELYGGTFTVLHWLVCKSECKRTCQSLNNVAVSSPKIVVMIPEKLGIIDTIPDPNLPNTPQHARVYPVPGFPITSPTPTTPGTLKPLPQLVPKGVPTPTPTTCPRTCPKPGFGPSHGVGGCVIVGVVLIDILVDTDPIADPRLRPRRIPPRVGPTWDNVCCKCRRYAGSVWSYRTFETVCNVDMGTSIDECCDTLCDPGWEYDSAEKGPCPGFDL